MRSVYRKEEKYMMYYQEAVTLQNYISNILKKDDNNIPGGYMVRTLYFDTPYCRDYYHKINSIEKRRKIRIRCYKSAQTLA